MINFTIIVNSVLFLIPPQLVMLKSVVKKNQMKNILRLGDKLSLNIKGFNPIFILKITSCNFMKIRQF